MYRRKLFSWCYQPSRGSALWSDWYFNDLLVIVLGDRLHFVHFGELHQHELIAHAQLFAYKLCRTQQIPGTTYKQSIFCVTNSKHAAEATLSACVKICLLHHEKCTIVLCGGRSEECQEISENASHSMGFRICIVSVHSIWFIFKMCMHDKGLCLWSYVFSTKFIVQLFTLF